MCGISGIIRYDRQDSTELVKRLNSKIPHRGPDSEGYYFNNGVSFGHKRLSIIDLSDAAKQPFTFGDYTIVFNGEIYNYIEIRSELEKLGIKFNTNSDTEVIVKAFQHWEEKCVSHFNGMWSFAIYDRQKDLVFCSRDRFGVKPFYFSRNENEFVFASELKQIVSLKEKVYANKKAVINFLVAGFEDYSTETFFQDIEQLKPGHNMVISIAGNKIVSEAYYSLKYHNEYSTITLNDAKTEFLKKFKQSIKYRLRSDVPVGTCLSGGLDSSSVAAIASQEYYKQTGNKFLAFTASSIDPSNDEWNYAKIVADTFPIDWKVVKPNVDSFSNVLEEVIYQLDEPFASPSVYMQYFVMKMIKEANCTVVLDGQGGDETFLGYERYYPVITGNIWSPKAWSRAHSIAKHSKLSFTDVLKYRLYFTNAKLRKNTLLKRNSFIKNDFFDLLENDLLSELSGSYKNINDLQKLEITKTQLPHLLKYEDRNSMKFSIEARLPFLDFNLVEFAYSLPIELKLNDGWTKKIVRESMTGILPNEIAWRKNKIGFEAPKKNWLESIEDMDQTIRSSNMLNQIVKVIPGNYFDLNQKWKLFNIAKWEKIYNIQW